MSDERQRIPDRTKSSGYAKKPYARPRLTSHGDAREITRALGPAGADGQGGSQQFDSPT